MKKLLLLCLSPFFLSACQVMTESECKSANWTDLGRQDGLKGFAPRIYSRADACVKHGITVPAVEIEKYQHAYQSGIQQYCQPKNIFDLSIIGEARINACPEPNYSRVKPIYEVGYKYYQNKEDVERLRKEIDDLDDQLIRNTDKAKKETLMEDRIKKSRELSRLQDDQIRLDRELELIRPK